MKDAKGHGSDQRGGSHATGVDQVGRHAMTHADRVSRAPGFLERMGRASKRGFSPV